MEPRQIQDLADAMGDLLKARQDFDLSFTVRIDLKGKEAPPEAVVIEVNRVLKSVCGDLQI